MNVFLDANVLVSVLNKEYPLFTYSSRILSLTEQKGNYQLYTSPVCLAISFYFSEKKSGRQIAKKKIRLLISKINTTTIDNTTVLKAVGDKAVEDFEDGLEYYSALQSACDFIITENIEDFYFSQIPVCNSEQFLEQYLF
ncbi:PIN domain-containing protein [Membranihabitans maritimus]|uniref:PIN domain-containing protein n=1 Tax=Membranihabitans maritimus TaxID=2904244 RepID=UPI001F46942C|nr:PIN domain-containing protein [Membranihabitans maritimus]